MIAETNQTVPWRVCYKVSEPSIIRFCHRLDRDGFPDFRLKLAQHQPAPVASPQEPGRDRLAAMVDDIFQRAGQAIDEARRDLDLVALRAAVAMLHRAWRVDIYGYCSSGFMASEAQHRLAGLEIAVVAYSDPTLQMRSGARGAERVPRATGRSRADHAEAWYGVHSH